MNTYEIIILLLGSGCGIGIISKFYTLLKNNIEQRKETDDLIKKSLQMLLRCELQTKYKEYKGRGWASDEEKNSYLDIYTVYHSLGNNGVMTNKMNEVMTLPEENCPN